MQNGKQYFSVQDSALCYNGSPLREQPFFDEVKEVMEAHIVPDKDPRTLWKSLVFCIASSQNLNFERAVALTTSLNDEPLARVSNGSFIYSMAHPHLRFREDRFSPMFTHVNSHAKGIEGLTHDFLEDPTLREEMVREVNYVGPKTASFWHLCLGGKKLLTLDVHNLRQLAGLGIDMKKGYHTPVPRSSGVTEGKKVVITPPHKDYYRIEQEALELLVQFPELCSDGEVNGALATSLFWWAGARAERGNTPGQGMLFGAPFKSPYT